MAKNLKLVTIDTIIDDFDLDAPNARENIEMEAVTIWLPVEDKKVFDLLQARSRKRFGKLMKKVVKHTLDRVARDIKKAS